MIKSFPTVVIVCAFTAAKWESLFQRQSTYTSMHLPCLKADSVKVRFTICKVGPTLVMQCEMWVWRRLKIEIPCRDQLTLLVILKKGHSFSYQKSNIILRAIYYSKLEISLLLSSLLDRIFLSNCWVRKKQELKPGVMAESLAQNAELSHCFKQALSERKQTGSTVFNCSPMLSSTLLTF